MMKSKKLISAILAAASIAGGVVGAQAQDYDTLDSKVNNVIYDLNRQNNKIEALENKVKGIDTTGVATNKVQIEKNKALIAANKLGIDANTEAVKKLNNKTEKLGFKADTALKVAGNGAMQNGATNLTDGVNQNTRLVEAEVAARKDADTKLQANIDAEATARKAADQKLQTQIDKNGIKADTALKVAGNGAMQNGATNLTDGVNQNTRLVEAEAKARDDADKAEAAARKDADQKLQAKIDAEATARENADQKLQTQIDTNKQNIDKNSSDIKTLKDNWKDSERAFNADQVHKIDSNKANIDLLHRRVDDQQTKIDKNGFKADTALKVAGNGAMQNGATNLTDGVNQNTRLVEAEATARKDADQKLQTQIDTNKQQISQNQQNIDKNGIKADTALKVIGNGAMQNGATNLTDGVNQNTRLVEAEAAARKDADTKLQANIEAEATARKDADQKLQTQIDKNGIKADTALKVIGNGAMQNGATNLTDGVNQNTRLVEAEAKARDDADKKLQNNIDNEAAARIAGDNALNSRIDQVASDANKGIAKASALAALHPLDYDPDNKFDIAAAGGFYKGENAFALGAFYRPNRNVMLSMGTTLTGGDNAYNVGLTFKIGKSGKHTEAGLTTADLYAMIGAMQDKMDQQQKKIEELEAKQAK